MTGRYERVEVITGVARRRPWSAAEKLRIVGDLARPGASVSLVARDHDVSPSLLFKWRRLAREGLWPLPDEGPSFVPIRLVTAEKPSARVEEVPGSPAGEVADSMIEIALPNGCRLRVPTAIDGAALRRLLTVLKTAV